MQKALEKQVEQQKKLIEFMRKKFKENTGKQIQLPQTWQKLLNIAQQQAPIIPLEQAIRQQKVDEQAVTFAQAVTALNLPSRLVDTKKAKQAAAAGDKDSKKKPALSTNFDPTNKFHMVEVINLSGFQFRKFSKNRFRDFVESITDMRCLHSLILQNNGIDDSCMEEVEAIFAIKRITRLDLSRNRMDKLSGSNIAKILASSSHLEWLDISRNYFNFDYITCSLILNSLKLQTKMFHICMDIQESKENKDKDLPANFAAILKTKVNYHSFCPIDTRISQASAKNICSVLQSKQHHLTCLNFNFCFIQNPQLTLLCKSLQVNRTLIKLNLSNNGFSNASGIMICQVLKNNVTLIDINLSKNSLGDMFATSLARSLETNDTVMVIDISNNLVQTEGAQSLIKCLTEVNDTLESLGDISESLTLGIYNIQKLKKALRINTVSKELRKKIMENVGDQAIDPEKVANSQTLAFLEAEYNDYKLIRPIVFTNAFKSDYTDFKLWNIR